MPVTFKEVSTPREPWAIEVRDDNAVVGHIRQRPDTGYYCYYPGQDNHRNPTRQVLGP